MRKCKIREPVVGFPALYISPRPPISSVLFHRNITRSHFPGSLTGVTGLFLVSQRCCSLGGPRGHRWQWRVCRDEPSPFSLLLQIDTAGLGC